MNALTFYQRHADDGRAMLAPQPIERDRGRGRPPQEEGLQWLVRIKNRLILCVDSEYPALRFVDDHESVVEHQCGGYRL